MKEAKISSFYKHYQLDSDSDFYKSFLFSPDGAQFLTTNESGKFSVATLNNNTFLNESDRSNATHLSFPQGEPVYDSKWYVNERDFILQASSTAVYVKKN